MVSDALVLAESITHLEEKGKAGQKSNLNRPFFWFPKYAKGRPSAKEGPPLLSAHFRCRTGHFISSYMTALMVCIRFSASSKTMERSDSKTSSVTSMALRPNFSPISLPTFVLWSW